MNPMIVDTLCLFVLCLGRMHPAEAKLVHVSVDLHSPSAITGWRFLSGKWGIDRGIIEQTDERLVGATALLRSPVCSDFKITVSFKPTAGSGVRAAGLVFRVQGQRTFYYVHLDARADKAMLVMSTPEQMWNELARVAQVGIHLDGWNTARVECVGPAIRVSVNGRLVLEELDDTFVGGGFGLRTSQGHVLFRNLSIEGQTMEPTRAKRYQRPPFTVVCADAGAGADEEFPDVARLSNGDLICVFYAGYAHGSKPGPALRKGGRIAFVKSSDGGRTWSPARTLYDSPWDDRDPSICEVAPGRLLCNFFTYHYPDHAHGVNATSETYVLSSNDYGETWDAKPTPVPSPFSGSCSTSDPVHLLPDGTLLMGVYGYNTGRPYHYIPAVVRSVDGGRTWGDASIIVADSPDSLTEPALCLLPNGRLVCHLRPFMLQSYSADGGRRWTKPMKLPFPGDAPYLLLTSNGLLLSAFRHPGTSLAYSFDLGSTWHGPRRLDICQGAYPSMVEMAAGTVLFVYCTGGAQSDIRALRLRVDRNGVHPIPRLPVGGRQRARRHAR